MSANIQITHILKGYYWYFFLQFKSTYSKRKLLEISLSNKEAMKCDASKKE